ncbi:hypothetical protein Tco_0199606 [Tanacetum coccineum]
MPSNLSSLKSDTLEIKSIMTEIYQAFKGRNVLTHRPATKEPPSHTEGEHVAMKNDTEKLESDKVEEEPTNAVLISTVKPTETLTPEKLVPASKVVREDPDEPVRVPYMINVKMHYLTNDEINAHMEKENLIKTAAEEAKMFEMTKTEVIKVVQEEAEKIRLDPKTIVSAKADEKFKKAQDAKH